MNSPTNIKYDYDKHLRLAQNVPNLTSKFQQLAKIRTTKNLYSSKFVLLCIMGTTTFVTSSFLNFNLFNKGEDINIEFKIVPDYATGKRVVTYRKADKRFYL